MCVCVCVCVFWGRGEGGDSLTPAPLARSGPLGFSATSDAWELMFMEQQKNRYPKTEATNQLLILTPAPAIENADNPTLRGT